MGELRARNPMPRWSSSSMRVMSSPARRRRRDPRTRARSRRRSGRRATGRGPGGLRRWRRGRSRRGSWDGVRCTVSKNPSPAHLIAKRLLLGCRGHFPAKRGSWDVSREHPDKHVIFMNGSDEPSRREGPVTHSAELLESTGVRSPGRSPVYEATAPLAASRQDASPHDPVRVAKGPATLRNSVFHPALADAIIGL